MTDQPTPDPKNVVDAISAGDSAIDAAHSGVSETTKAVRNELYGTVEAVNAAIRATKTIGN